MLMSRDKYIEIIVTTLLGALCNYLLSGLPGLANPTLKPVEEARPEVVQALAPKPTRVEAPPPPPVPPVPIEKGWEDVSPLPAGDEEFIHQCSDGGKTGKFRAVFLSKEYNWALESDSVVQLNGRDIDFSSVLRQPGFKDRLRLSPELIAIGTASCEGTREHEELRAARRSRQICAWLKGETPQPEDRRSKSFYRLNLGQFVSSECAREQRQRSMEQRQLMILIVEHRDPELDLELCLYQALSQRTHSQHLVKDYTQFELLPATDL